jgi:hypothetical protein
MASCSNRIVGGMGDKALIEGRCNELRKQITETKSDYDREKLEERMAKLPVRPPRLMLPLL